MALRGNLFVKMFIGFWLATVTILVSWMLSSHYFDSRSEAGPGALPPPPPQHGRMPPHRFVLRTMYQLQHMSDAELRGAIAEARRHRGIDIFLLRRDGSELFGQAVPAEARRLASRLRGGERRATDEYRGKRLLAHVVYREGEGLLRAVLVVPRPARGLLRALGENLWMRIALAVGISGLVCFALSRIMTRRLNELGRASRRLAQGDLDTRLAVRPRGGDETDELARDFNSMAAQLQDRIEAQRRLLSDVSHELRSPLARLRVALALAEEDPAELPAHLQRIGRETGRLDELIQQLLSTSGGKIVLDNHIDLAALMRQLCADAGFEGEARKLRVKLDCRQEQAIVASSADLLHKSFENILRNALHYTATGSEISVAVFREDADIVVTVEDRGPGVPPEQLDSIFNEFYRVDTARSRESGGYGLGLSIARRAILSHGGEISAANTEGGLRVSVRLPLWQGDGGDGGNRESRKGARLP